MNRFAVAARIGMTVREMEDSLSAEEYAHWLAFLKLTAGPAK
ncbi:hypothetical protein [Hoeflea sp.]